MCYNKINPNMEKGVVCVKILVACEESLAVNTPMGNIGGLKIGFRKTRKQEVVLFRALPALWLNNGDKERRKS